VTGLPAERLLAAADLLDQPPTDDVGKELAAWLRDEAHRRGIDPTQAAAFAEDRLDEPVRMVSYANVHAIAIADLLLAGTS
jgi:transglutaminase-like putative cysteine protease